MRGIMRGKCSSRNFLMVSAIVHIRLRFGRLPPAAAVETVFRVDAAGGTRRGGLPGEVRALPLSHVDAVLCMGRGYRR